MRNNTTNVRNILSLWLGVFLSRMRQQRSISANDLSTTMKFSTPYLRMVENGLTNIAPARALDVLIGFTDLFSLNGYLSSLSNYLVAVQYLSTYDDVKSTKAALQDLKDADKGLEKLLSNINDIHWKYLEEQDYDELKNSFGKKPFVEELEKYLTNPYYALNQVDGIAQNWADLYGKTPSLFQDFLYRRYNSIKNDIEDLISYSQYYSLSDWEDNNEKMIVKCLGITRSIDHLLLDSDKFKWSFLKNKSFKSLKCIIFEPYNSLKEDKLFSIISEQCQIPIDKARQLINLVTLPSDEVEYICNHLPRYTKSLNIDYWLYELKNTNKIGFCITFQDSLPIELSKQYLNYTLYDTSEILSNDEIREIFTIINQYL